MPIYWGAPDVKQEFNPAAFLCADDYPDTAALIAAIDEIDRDDEKFLAMCHAPILAPDGSSRAARYVTDEACAEFLTGIFEKGPHLRRNRSCWGSIYEGDWKYYRRLAEADRKRRDCCNGFWGGNSSIPGQRNKTRERWLTRWRRSRILKRTSRKNSAFRGRAGW